jgi:hypothetical protein
MKKQMTWLLAAMLATSVTLGGCGGSAPQATTESQEAAVVEEEAADPKEKFLGEWKFAYIESDGLTMVGDLSALEETVGESVNIGVTFNEDGTGQVVAGDEKLDVTWELNDDGDLVATQVEDKEAEPMTFKYEDGELHGINVSIDEETSEQSELIISFTHDGKSEKVTAPKVADATDITSADALVGKWNLSGMSFMGITFSGSSEKVAEMFSDQSVATEFKDDGTCSFFDQDCKYTVSDSGATIDYEGSSVPVKQLGDNIIVDLTESLGAALGMDSEFFFIYSRA